MGVRYEVSSENFSFYMGEVWDHFPTCSPAQFWDGKYHPSFADSGTIAPEKHSYYRRGIRHLADPSPVNRVTN
jgi:hypothetical protein